MMKALLLIVVLFLTGSAFSEGEDSHSTEDSTHTGLFELIMELTGSTVRSWAKPIEYVDMDRMMELIESGLISFHKADWYAVVDDE
ncbi:MAG: hypothetical protein GQ565_00095 [Candidatus Aegiribacteria sp.]|nr:hypothetical protein [Candidatus Aegiribacteria sp.]